MKGRLEKTEDGYWKVLYTKYHPKVMVKEFNMSLPLHPKNVIDIEQHIEDIRIAYNQPANMEVEWDWCVIVTPNGIGVEYAKIIEPFNN